MQLAMSKYGLLLLLCLALKGVDAQSVDSLSGRILSFPSRLLGHIKSRTADLNHQLTNQTEKMLKKMASQEARLQKKLAAADPAAAKTLFADVNQHYAALAGQIRNDTSLHGRSFSGIYPPYLDSLQGSVAFLHQNPQSLSGSKGSLSPDQLRQLADANTQLQALQAKMMDAAQVQAYIQQRKQQLSQYVTQHANFQSLFSKPLAGMNKQAYYYSQQVREYKEMWNNPDRLTHQVLVLLNRLPAFQVFMKDHSMLTGLFQLPGNYGTAKAIDGLQTKDQVAQLIKTQVSGHAPDSGAASTPEGGANPNPGGGAGMDALQSSLQQAQSQLDTYKSKLDKLGAGNGDMDRPNFKPNDQRTKTFLSRLELGADFQTTHNNYYFPMVTDLGLSVGYKLGHNNVVGVGASYKLGWGNGIRDISLSSQGVGLRSFLQVRLKGSLSASGGFEYNYTTPFTSYQQLRQLQYWTRSGLIGLTKILALKNRVFKKTSVSLLWDFLSYQQVPKTQPLLFRLGYTWH
jgi:hypothetical protein